MNRVLVALPVDARPAVRSQVQDMVACAGWDLRMPPVEWLGHLRRPGERDALQHWLAQQAAQAAGFVVSLDMLVYGGLVPSRFIDDSLPSLQSRLECLQTLHRRWPRKPIFAFAATMRISNNQVAEEEKSYWAEHGTALWSWSFHQDRAGQVANPQEAAHSRREVRRLEEQIPHSVRTDYLLTRQRNLQVTLGALEMVKTGVISRLVLPQDDTAEFGLNVAERRHLQLHAQALGIEPKVALYPGADEVMHTLCARMVGQREGREALRVFVLPSDPTGIAGLRARYEDRIVPESIQSQLHAVGARQVSQLDEADVVLGVHTQGQEQGDWAMRIELPRRTHLHPEWTATLRRARTSGRALALADLAYANGGDPWLLTQGLPLLDVYAGWNTASNTLGSVLAQCVLAHGRFHELPARRALALRLLEDLLYQAQVRQQLRAQVDEAHSAPEELLRAARQLMLPAARDFAKAHGLSHRLAELYLPWNRSFEVDLRLEPCA